MRKSFRGPEKHTAPFEPLRASSSVGIARLATGKKRTLSRSLTRTPPLDHRVVLGIDLPPHPQKEGCSRGPTRRPRPALLVAIELASPAPPYFGTPHLGTPYLGTPYLGTPRAAANNPTTAPGDYRCCLLPSPSREFAEEGLSR